MAHPASPFRSILLPVDGSPFAEQAIPLASHIAQRTGGKLRLALVHELPPPPHGPASARLYTSIELATRKSERGYLRGLQAKLREGGTRLSSAVTLTGEPRSALVEYVREMGIDLVIMATHGRGGIQRAWLGSVADYLVRNLEVPVLLVRPKEDGSAPHPSPGAGQILVPLDGSPLAEEVLDTAGALARAWDTELTFLRVVLPVVLSENSAFTYPTSHDEELTTLGREEAQDYLRNIVERMHERGIRASSAAVVGWNPVQSILEVARPEQVAMIALASHGRGGLGRIALGSVADKLVRGADVPVLVYHSKGRKKKKLSRSS